MILVTLCDNVRFRTKLPLFVKFVKSGTKYGTSESQMWTEIGTDAQADGLKDCL